MTLRIIARILGRVVGLTLAGALGCAVVGVVVGGLFGVICVLLPGDDTPPSADYLWMMVGTAGEFGAAIGAWLGGGLGAFSFFLVSLLLSAQAKAGAAWVKGVNGAFWGALLGASAGAMTGDLLVNPLKRASSPLKHFFDFGNGFFYGSIAGFCLGLFIGAVWAGLSRKPFPFRTPLLWLRAKMTRRRLTPPVG